MHSTTQRGRPPTARAGQLAALLLAALAVAGCGQKGDLYLPGDRQTLAGHPDPAATG